MAVVTISRLYGSQGQEIAKQVCEQLGYRYFDTSLMEQLGRETGLVLDSLEELPGEVPKVRSTIDKLYASVPPWVGQGATWSMNRTLVPDERLTVETVERLLHEAYERGKVVILGRGSQVVLRHKPDVLHVRIVAPLENRVRTVATREGLDANAARDLIRRRDQAAFEYLQDQYRINPGDSQLYDMVLNTGKLTFDAAADLIVNAVRRLPA